MKKTKAIELKPIKFKPLQVKPLYTIDTPRAKKNLRYWQTNLKPLGDVDHDKKINLLDCYPYDPNRQGLTDFVGKIKKKVKKEEPKKDYIYVIALVGNRWHAMGPYTKENIQAIQEELRGLRNVRDYDFVSNPKEADRRNRRIMMKEAKDVAVSTAKTMGSATKKSYEAYDKLTPERGIKSAGRNVREGLRPNDDISIDDDESIGGRATVGRMRRRPSRRPSSVPSGAKPPYPEGWAMGWKEEEPQPQEYEGYEESPEEYPAQEPRRKLPPRTQPYSPITVEQSFLPNKGYVGRPPKVILFRPEFVKFGVPVKKEEVEYEE